MCINILPVITRDQDTKCFYQLNTMFMFLIGLVHGLFILVYILLNKNESIFPLVTDRFRLYFFLCLLLSGEDLSLIEEKKVLCNNYELLFYSSFNLLS